MDALAERVEHFPVDYHGTYSRETSTWIMTDLSGRHEHFNQVSAP